MTKLVLAYMLAYANAMDVGTVLAAMADPTRRKILESVRKGPRAVSDIAADFDVSRPAVSQHLRVLAEARLVRQYKSGRNHFYTLDMAGLTLVREYLDGFWSDVLRCFQDAAIAEAAKKRGGTSS
jgi:DNA-binding transcriptional ArsR family regulator